MSTAMDRLQARVSRRPLLGTLAATLAKSAPQPAFAAIACSLFASAAAAQENSVELAPHPAIDCPSCDAWNRSVEPFRVFGNTHYVGPAGLSSILIASDDGLVLLDGGLPQSASLIADNIARLGFDLADLRLIVTSHTHYDHVGGVAALARATGARVAASPRSAQALMEGRANPDDPQYAEPTSGFPPVANVTAIADGETLRVGDIALTAHFTPGHTPGGTSWTWRSCEDGRCLDIVYADSLTPVSSDGFRFSDTPGRVAEFEASIDRVASLPCDILISTHPDFVQLEEKLEAWRARPEENPFIDPGACAAYAAAARDRLATRVEAEEAEADTAAAQQ